jgi:hypothetical protein
MDSCCDTLLPWAFGEWVRLEELPVWKSLSFARTKCAGCVRFSTSRIWTLMMNFNDYCTSTLLLHMC